MLRIRCFLIKRKKLFGRPNTLQEIQKLVSLIIKTTYSEQ